MENIEIWKDIPNYEGMYKINNIGEVISFYKGKKTKLKQIKGFDGYLYVNLYKNKKMKQCKIHQLVAIVFLNHTPCGYKFVVNHKNFIRTDNRVENLEIVTSRENTNLKHIKSSSKYTGVHWSKKSKIWVSSIYFKKKTIYLGSYINEIDAHNAYQNKLSQYLIDD